MESPFYFQARQFLLATPEIGFLIISRCHYDCSSWNELLSDAPEGSRRRIGLRPLPAEEMGVPPRIQTRAGRANPAGIPLHAAEEEETAVAEIRPHIGAVITIATLISNEELKVADLTNCPSSPRHSGIESSRRTSQDSHSSHFQRRNCPSRSNRRSRISNISPHTAEAILDIGYDGIRYTSAMVEGGKNAVFFDAKNPQPPPPY